MKVMWSTQILRYITCQAFADESQLKQGMLGIRK